MKYLALIDAIALLHQHQRKIATVEVDGAAVEYVEVTEADIALANRLAHAVLGRSLDELVCGAAAASQGSRETVREAPELYVGSREERTLLVRYRALPPKRREAVLELLKPIR